MTRFSHLFTAALAAIGGAHAASSVLDLIPSNFDDIVLKSGKPALVEFFAPWCGHCKKLAPIYEDLAKNFDFAKDKVSIAKVDADAEKDLGRRFGIQGFPTLKWFDGKSDQPEDYQGGRDLESLTEFVAEKTGVRMKKKASTPSAVQMLTDTSFKTEIGGDKDALVAFTAPWCGHCKTLAPIWETLAQDFTSEPSVLIAKVDAEAATSKATAQQHDISSYPTIKFFPRGSTVPEDYTGGRSEADLVAYVNRKAGTHRAVGGGLDGAAGTIDALDTILAQLTPPLPGSGGEKKTIADLSADLTAVAKDIRGKYVEYYLKVSQKLGQNEGYVEKELGRVEGLIRKGGLAREKLDDLVSRSNILRKFRREGVEGVKDEL